MNCKKIFLKTRYPNLIYDKTRLKGNLLFSVPLSSWGMWSFRVRGPAGAATTLEISPEAQLSEFCGKRALYFLLICCVIVALMTCDSTADLTARKLGLVGHENDLTCASPSAYSTLSTRVLMLFVS